MPKFRFSAIISKLNIFENQMKLNVDWFKVLVTMMTSFFCLEQGKGGRGWPRDYFSAIISELNIVERQMKLYVDWFKVLATMVTSYL